MTKLEEIALKIFCYQTLLDNEHDLEYAFNSAQNFINYSHSIGADKPDNTFTKDEVKILYTLLGCAITDTNGIAEYKQLITKLDTLCK